jgi:hypothetical protein
MSKYTIQNDPSILNVSYYEPLVRRRAPTNRDFAPLGTPWVDRIAQDIFFIVEINSTGAVWANAAGGAGTFNSVIVNPDDLTVTAGDVIVTAGDVDVAAGTLTLGALGAGVMQTSAVGLVTSTSGMDGQIMISGTGLPPAWALPTCDDGTIVLVPGANSLIIRATGAAVNQYTTTAGGPAVPLAGNLNLVGYDANITTDGTIANTVRVRLADNITSVGSITSSVDFNVLAGTTEIRSNTNAVGSILLLANGGVNESIVIESNLGTALTAIELAAILGGVFIAGGLNSANAIHLNATSVAGGMTFTAGTNGETHTITNGAFSVTTGTGNLTIGTDAAQHNISLGSITGTSAFTAQAGTGAMSFTAGGIFDVNAVGAVTIDSTGGNLSIGAGADAFNINIGTGGAQRVITLGNATAATSVIVNGGTGLMQFGANAISHTVEIGSVAGTSAFTAQAGTGAMTFTAGGIFDVNAVGAATIDSTGAAISIGSGADNFAVNIGNNGTRTVTVGSVTAASGTAIRSGTNGIDFTAAGIVRMAQAVDTQAANAVTINANVGKGTFTGLTTAAGTEEILTVTNNLCTVTSPVLVTIASATAGADVMLTIQHVELLNGSFKVYYVNQGAAALATNVILTFWLLS